ncbi:hypothetical protein GGH98_006278, partial [Coemansia sp. RSA 454]
KLNDASITKYEGLSRQAQDMLVHAYKIKQTYNEMTLQIAQVDSLVESVDTLEHVAQELDRKHWKPYSSQFGQIPKLQVLKGDALDLSAKFMDLFIKEAIERAKAKRAESSDAHKPVDESDLEKILAQLLLDL